ncbi:MAG: 1-acyl-sn-glycerol-3-phosphate acyltransferase [Firmicutes bacterium]|jgi:1-acyl-sn-glycerol-3-phosphate acyltransferase|nr:1-acyl-sn-glycerol-3-phosphate acyltransferase [Bacillota bacterium]
MFYRFVRRLFLLIFSVFFRWQVKGRENIPSEGPFILCANHISWMDPILLGCLTGRVVRFMAKEELFQRPLSRIVVKGLHAFPVKRQAADRRAIKTALSILVSGQGVGIFPEGTRSKTKELLPPLPGVGFLAVKSEAPVVPVAICGPYRLLRPLRVVIGKQLTFPDYYGVKVKSEQLEEVAAGIMAEIARLHRSQKG